MKIPRTSGHKYRRANDGVPTWNELREMRAKRMGESAALKIQEQSIMIMNQDSNNGSASPAPIPASPSKDFMPFSYGSNTIRTVAGIDGKTWFVAADVCKVLEISNTSQAVETLDEDEKGICITYTPSGDQRVLIVSREGTYELILKSRKAEAKAFKRWIKHEVLPCIEKTGGYQLGPQIPRTLPDCLRAYALEVEKSEQLALQVATMAPKAEFFDAVTASQDTLDMNRACKTLGVGRNKMFRELRGHKVFTDENLPMQQFIDCGYFAVSESKWEHPVTGETHITLSTRVFQKGLEFLRRKAGEYGLIELN